MFLLRFLEPSFPPVSGQGQVFDHIVAVLADASLQAAVNYETVVQPRVQHILQTHPSCRCTADLVALLHAVSAEELLQWRGARKLAVFESLIDVLVLRDIENVDELTEWVITTEARSLLLGIDGVGKKTYDYLCFLCGHSAIPIDRHLARFLLIADRSTEKLGYTDCQRLLSESCRQLSIDPTKAQRALWQLMRDCT